MGEYEGVYEDRGKCRIIWREGKKRRSLTLDIPFSPAGVKRAWKIRQQHITAHRKGEDYRGQTPAFHKLAQTRLNTANLTPESRRTQKSYLNNYWHPFFNRPVDQIQYDDLLDAFSNLDVSPKTMKMILSAGSQVFELAIKSGWRTDNPAKIMSSEIKLIRRKIDPFTRKERDMILDNLNEPQQYLFYAIRFYCGLRPSEAIALRWYDYRDNTFQVTKGRVRGNEGPTKTKVERVVPVHPFVQEALRKTPRQLKDDHIIVNQHGVGYTSSTMLSNAFARTLKRCGIRYRSPYNARHTCATMMLEAGMKPAYCAKVLGHSLQMFFQVYADWIDKDEADTQAKIWAEIQ